MHGVGKWRKLGGHCHPPLLSFCRFPPWWRKWRTFSRNFCHYGENGEHFSAIFRHSCHFLPFSPSIFSPFSPFLLFFPKDRCQHGNEPTHSLKSRRGWGNSLIEVWMNWKPVGEGMVWREYGRWMAIGEGEGWDCCREDRPRLGRGRWIEKGKCKEQKGRRELRSWLGMVRRGFIWNVDGWGWGLGML